MRFTTKRFLNTGLSLVLAFALCPAAPALAVDDSDAGEASCAEAAPDQVIVVYKKAQGMQALQVAEASEDAADAELLASQLGSYGAAVQVTLEDGVSVDEAVSEFSQMSNVAFAQPNFSYKLLENNTAQSTADDPFMSDQYYLGAWDETFSTDCGANVEAAWQTAACNGEVTVAILDTGCNLNHVDLKDNLVSDLVYNAVNGTTNVNDTLGHGTHCAGLAGAVANNSVGMAGSSYNAKILPIKVFSGENCYTSYLITAYAYLDGLIENGTLDDLHVINMSLGGYGSYTSDDQALESAIAELRDNHDVLTVCAGGNGDDYGKAYVDTPMYPGDYDECFCVTALNKNGTNCTWSDYNQYKDISAPGYSLLSTVPDSYTTSIYSSGTNATYAYMSGTSMASPLVAGIAALLWAVDPDLTVDDAVSAMESTAHAVNPASNDWSAKSGSAGAIDAAAAVKYVADNVDPSIVSLSQAQIELDQDCFIADGSECRPQVTVTCNGQTLKEGVHYQLSYVNNVSVGTGTVVASAISGSGYRGSVRATFRICKELSKGGWMSSIASQHYTASAITPNVRVYDADNKLLTRNVDYELSYEDNVYPGTARVVATGIGTYNGSISKSFTIEDDAADLRKAIAAGEGDMENILRADSAATVRVDKKWVFSQKYDALADALAAGKELVESYKASGSYSTAAGSVCIAAIESAQAAFLEAVQPGAQLIDISSAQVSGVEASYDYTGLPIKPVPTVAFEGSLLAEGTDYTVSYSGGCVYGGACQVIVKGTGLYEGSVAVAYDIVGYTAQEVDASQVSVGSLVAGSGTIDLSVGTTKLVEGIDYTVAYYSDLLCTASVNPATAPAGSKVYARVTFMGAWSGCVVKPLVVAAKEAFKAATAEVTVTAKAGKVKVASPAKRKVKVTWSAKAGKAAKVTGYRVVLLCNGKVVKRGYVKGCAKASVTYKLAAKYRGKKVHAKVTAYKLSAGKKVFGPVSTLSKAVKVKK